MKKKSEINKPFHYTQCGLDYVFLLNGVDFYEHDGEVFYKIEDVDGLHDFIAEKIVFSPRPIRGMELRFLRSLLKMSQSSLAANMGKKRDAIAKAEADLYKKVSDAVDRLVRFFYLAKKADPEGISQLMDIMDDIAEEEYQQEFQLNYDDNWNARLVA